MHRTTLVALILAFTAAACSSDNSSTTGTGAKEKEKAKKDKGPPPPPCHPGCFPAGTPIVTPDGVRAIESIAEGDSVTLVSPDGTAVRGRVHSSFRTDNRLVEVRTESSSLVTTRTQPLCRTDSTFCTAEELKAGDRVWRWQDGSRRADRVLSVAQTGREAPVFNLVVGESAVFIAGGFLARGKPPALAESAE